VNPLSGILLSMLDLTVENCGRFRDCFLAREAGEDKPLEIHVYTRNGGGNREAFQEVTDTLQKHPQYISDSDDDFDCTYATYKFKVPEQFVENLMELVAEDTSAIPPSPQERFQNFLTKLESKDKDDPEVQRVLGVMKPLFDKLNATLAEPDPVSYAQQLDDLVLSVLYDDIKDGDPIPPDTVFAEGVIRRFGFDPVKLKANRVKIIDLLRAILPDSFYKDKGGGHSFLALAHTKDGEHWGEHRHIEALICLGIAAGVGQYVVPREKWNMLPGGMPYVVFDLDAPPKVGGS
jgi:hypothetical protein